MFEANDLSGDAEPSARRSLTADIVSVARGIGVSRQLRDPMAIHFASADVKRLLEAVGSGERLGRVLRRALRHLSLGLIDHNTLRMLLIDDLLREWLASGCRQVVIVGAGMDSRGWRLAELADARLFELDRAPTQALKQGRSAGLPEVCRDVRFVRADLERDTLAEPLLREGFQTDEPAAWICEGVTPYLGVDSIARLLAQIAELSASGSRLALSYVAPKSGARDGRRGIAARLASRLGEPPRGLIEPEEMRRHVARAGLACVADLDWKQWTARVPAYRPVRNVFKEHLLIAAS
jgi:methyltransferase (TIGR00027 family)